MSLTVEPKSDLAALIAAAQDVPDDAAAIAADSLLFMLDDATLEEASLTAVGAYTYAEEALTAGRIADFRMWCAVSRLAVARIEAVA